MDMIAQSGENVVKFANYNGRNMEIATITKYKRDDEGNLVELFTRSHMDLASLRRLFYETIDELITVNGACFTFIVDDNGETKYRKKD